MGDRGLSWPSEFPRTGDLTGFVNVAQNGSTIKRGGEHMLAPHNGVPVTVYGIYRVQMPSPRERYDVVEVIVGNGYVEPTGKTWQAWSVEEARGFVPESHRKQFPATPKDHDTLVETWA